MKTLTPFALASVLLVSACTNLVKNKAVERPASESPSPSAIYHYSCNGGETISARYPTADTAKVHYKGRKHAMTIAVSGSGARYVGDGFEWWTKGSGSGAEGTLFRHGADVKSGPILENCKQL